MKNTLFTSIKKAPKMYGIYLKECTDQECGLVAIYSTRALAKDNLDDLAGDDEDYFIRRFAIDYRVEL